jgi:hypothetical protein
LGGIWLAVWNFQKTRLKEAESRIFAQKAEAYQSLVDVVRDIFMVQKGWKQQEQEDSLPKLLMVIRYKMIVWGGQDTIRAIAELESVPEDALPGDRFLAVENLYKAIRKDLGHQDDSDLSEELFLTQIIASEREAVRTLLREAKGRR